MRPDKLVLAGVEATLNLYRDPRRAVKEIPVLAMLTAAPDGLRERAAWLASRIDGSSLEAGTSSPGGGSFPGCELPTTLVTVNTEHPDALLSALREADPPVIGRSGEGRIMLDARTIADNEMATVADLVNRVRPAGAKP
jgi:L-seryl-tRNA(Ser) seleniumtransferase